MTDGGSLINGRGALIAVGVPLALAAFLIDLTMPLGVAAGVFHLTALLVVCCFPLQRNDLLILAAICTILIVLGFFSSSSAGVATALVIANRSLAIAAVWGVAIVLTTFEAPWKPWQEEAPSSLSIRAARDYATGAAEELKREEIAIGRIGTTVQQLRDHDFTSSSILTFVAWLIDENRRLEDVLARSRADLRLQLVRIAEQLNLGGSARQFVGEEQESLDSRRRMREQFRILLKSADAKAIGAAKRQPYRCVQPIAPYEQGRLPPASSFRDVQCFDIASDGFSFLAVEPPSSDSLVVGLGPERDCIFLTADVSNVEKIEDAGCSYFHVNCEFRGRLAGIGQTVDTKLNPHEPSP